MKAIELVELGIDRVILSLVLNPEYYAQPKGSMITAAQYEHWGAIFDGIRASPRLQKKKPGKKSKTEHTTFLLKIGNRNLADFDVGHGYGNRFIKIGFNPSKLQDDEWKLLSDELFSLFLEPDGTSNAGVLAHARIKVEFFIDLGGVRKDELVFFARKLHRHKRFKHTTYMGAKGGWLAIKVYDKALERAEKGKKTKGTERTRIEFTLNQRICLWDLCQQEAGDFYSLLQCFRLRRILRGFTKRQRCECASQHRMACSRVRQGRVGGVFFKPVSNEQVHRFARASMLAGLYRVMG